MKLYDIMRVDQSHSTKPKASHMCTQQHFHRPTAPIARHQGAGISEGLRKQSITSTGLPSQAATTQETKTFVRSIVRFETRTLCEAHLWHFLEGLHTR